MPHSIVYNNRQINFEIVYRNRKNLSIIVEPDGNVRVAAPAQMKAAAIMEAMERNAGWIDRKLQLVEESLAGLSPRFFASGEKLVFRGRSYPCLFELNDRLATVNIKMDGDLITIRSPFQDRDMLKNALESWYTAQAKLVLPERVEHYEQLLNVRANGIRIKNHQKRWGSCSNKGNLNFNWRLILTPDEIIDYLVVHEMCHLKYMNHSQDFWSLMKVVMPDYAERRAWLKTHTGRLYAHLDYLES